ncbi:MULTISPECIES: CapE family protein [Cytobacillus]|nr:CapE family protein [Cytobacillus firmus]MCM3708362.1 CapE family protein [Cytobacillus firmus]
MNTVKKVTGWILPVVLVGTLLITMNTLKRTDTLTPDEQKKIEQHQNGQA